MRENDHSAMAIAARQAAGAGEHAMGIKGELIAFTPARSERYAKGLIDGLRNEAEKAGYAVTIIENEFDQAQEDQQVRQQLAAGATPDMWLWWPVDAVGSLSSLELLHATGIPVVQMNQVPSGPAEKLVVAYVGPDDALRARNAGRLVIEAQQVALDAGRELSSERGNAIAVTYPRSYGGYEVSMRAFREAISGSGINLIAEAGKGFGSAAGYAAASELIPQIQKHGVDFIYGMDDAILEGAIRALEEAGITVGEQVTAIGTVCNGDRLLLESGKQFGSTLQAPLFEGQLALKVAEEYLTTGKVSNFLNFTPNPIVRAAELEGFTVASADGKTYAIDEVATWHRGEEPAAPLEDVRLRLRAVRRRFGAIEALKEANFELAPGEVMALLGQNGAGKSTLVKIIGGFDDGYLGTIELDGQQTSLAPPSRAEELGIAVVQQELSLIPTMSVAENVFLAAPGTPSWETVGSLASRARPYLEQVGLGELDPATKVNRLSVGEQQLVEVARLLAREARILILDEPTAALGEAESERIVEMVRSLARSGKSVIYITHRLDEIFRVADRVTVIRDGRTQEPVAVSSLTVESLIERMIGRVLKEMFPVREPENIGEIVLEVDGLWPDELVAPVDLPVRAGEILGLAGQLGSGTSGLLATMAGTRPSRGGSLRVNGRSFRPTRQKQVLEASIAYCSPDRKHDGLFLTRPVLESMSAPALRTVSPFGWMQRRRELRLTTSLAESFQVDVSRLRARGSALSGGNQQKVAVGKWLGINPRVLLIDEPTRGVDVGARAEIYGRLRELTRAGVAVIFASTDFAEVMNLSDRVATFFRGELIRIFDNAAKADPAEVLRDITAPYGEVAA